VTERLVGFAWLQFVLTICGALYGVAVIDVLNDGGFAMACFDGDQQACAAGPVGPTDLWPALVAAAAVTAVAAAALVVAYRHRRGRARRFASIGVLGMSVALNGLLAIAVLSL